MADTPDPAAKKLRTPPLRRTTRGQAAVTLDGQTFYFGSLEDPQARVKYHRLIAEWEANGRRLPARLDRRQKALTVGDLADLYYQFASKYYRKNGKPTSTLPNVKRSLRALKALYADLPAAEFGPLQLKAVRHTFLEARTRGKPLTRGVVNAYVRTILRAFKWSASEGFLDGGVADALRCVEGLRKGRCEAPEGKPVQPVLEDHVQRVLPHLSPILCDMVRLQRLTGARPAEVCILRPMDVNRSGKEVWEYRPSEHKTEHHDRDRVLFIGPKAQAVLLKYLLRPADAYCFSPIESEAWRRAELRAARKSKVQPSQVNRRRRSPRKQPGKRYTTNTFRRAIHRACDDAEVPRWSPNRLRHSAGTEIRHRFGLEAVQVVLGHADAKTSEIYAEADRELARRIMAELG